jgi:hypothetical protein
MAGHCVDEFNPTSAHRKSEGTLIPEPQVLQDFWRLLWLHQNRPRRGKSQGNHSFVLR